MRNLSLHHHYSRRKFIGLAGKSALGLMLVERVLADPYRPASIPADDARPIKITGSVTVGGRPSAGVVVSDGVSVVASEADGRFVLHTTNRQEFVFCSIPSRASIPLNPSGTARFYETVAADGSEGQTIRFAFDEVREDESRHGFLVLADPQTLDAADVGRLHSETVPDVQALLRDSSRPMFGVGCGDLMFDKLEFFPDYERAVKGMGMPGFQVLGNHDVEVSATSDAASARTFRRYFGPNYYSFNRGEVHYVVLDDVLWFGTGYIGYIDDVQLSWLKQDLSFVEKGSRVVVFVHIPVYCFQHERMDLKRASNSEVVTNRDALYRILEGFNAHIIAGHMHESEHLVHGGISQHVCGAVCGGWWSGHMCGDGTPNGFAVYDMNGSSFRSYYKSTGRPREHQLRLFAPGADPSAPNSIIVNAWDADPRWEIFWYEDGMKKGRMAPRRGKDPLAVKLLDGEGLPKRHTWVDSYTTDHLYVAVPGNLKARILVEAIDPNGNTFRADTFEQF